jgi:hypothetical protein
MFGGMTYEEKLDKALRFLSDNSAKGESYNRYNELRDHLKTIQEIEENEYPMIAIHLIDDGYVRMFEPHTDILNGNEQIKIKYKGYIFINEGGYTQDKINKSKEKNRITILETWVAIGAGGLLIIELIKGIYFFCSNY